MTPPFDLATEWRKFEQCCIPEDAGEYQRQEMRHGFYAGAFVVFDVIAGTTKPDTRQEFFDSLDGIARELSRYSEVYNAIQTARGGSEDPASPDLPEATESKTTPLSQ